MELEFDKEIDALLRKARPTTGAPAGGHLDADAIAAFAEGAVPAVARKAYTAHLADCDSCREALTQIALLNEPAVTAASAVAAPYAPAAASPARAAVPWYSSLFRSPGLAAAMGILVIAFGGVLVYLVVQRGRPGETSVAFDRNSTAAVPYAGIDANTNAASDSAANMSSTATNTAANAASAIANTAVSPSAAVKASPSGIGTVTSSGTGSAAAEPPPVTAAPAPPTTAALADKPGDEAKSEKDDRTRDDKETARTGTVAEDRLATAAKRAAGAPLRGGGPVQNQIQSNNQAYEMTDARRVSGKTFRNSGGVWYDSAYHGQSTTNVRRGTDEFNKLDSGLRAIANELGGVVVVVWKSNAYRIQ